MKPMQVSKISDTHRETPQYRWNEADFRRNVAKRFWSKKARFEVLKSRWNEVNF